jgi:hypothetical protein
LGVRSALRVSRGDGALRLWEYVADPDASGLSHERPYRQAAAALTINRPQHVEIALDPTRLSACCYYAPLQPLTHKKRRY